KHLARDLILAVERGGEIILEAAREMEGRLFRGRVLLPDERGIARPADLDAAEQIGLGSRHAVDAGRLEARRRAEDRRVRAEAHARAAPVVHLAELLERAERLAARETLTVEPAAER